MKFEFPDHDISKNIKDVKLWNALASFDGCEW